MGNSFPEEETPELGCTYHAMYVLSMLLVVCTFPFSICFCFIVVQEYQKAVILRLGRCIGAKGPGLFFKMPCLDELTLIDTRTMAMDIPPQTVLTKDSVSVQVDAVVYYSVFDSVKAVTGIENYRSSTSLLAQTTLRNTLGTNTLAGILANREKIAGHMQDSIDVATDPWGIKVERVEIKDVRLPDMLQRAMAAEAEASREAEAKVIAAQGEMDASRALKNAADVINASPGALQLRYLQTLTTISAEKNSTIIFPLPTDMIRKGLKK